jgi:hypothetical protein
MRLLTSALCTTVAVGLLAGCSGSNLGSTSAVPGTGTGAAQSHFTNGHMVPQWSKYASVIPAELRPTGAHGVAKIMPDKKAKKGIYASEFYGSSIYGYKNPNSGNNPPICSESGISYPNGIAVDGKGNLIDPDGGSRTVIIFKGKAMCGPMLGSISDGYGQPSDASSANAATGKIAVGNIFDNSGAGSISVCTLSGGCTSNLTNANMYEVAGVAMAKNGDCWGDAINSAGTATLTYFKGCAGSGQAATGFSNAYYGGLDIDKAGNLVSISAFDQKVYVYKGCNPGCSLVGGPFSLSAGEAVFGHLDKKSKSLAVGDFQNGQIDVYKYSPSGITLNYSFNNGLSASLIVEGAAFNPRSKQ